MSDQEQPSAAPPCPTCGGRRRLKGFFPHPEDPYLRIEIYRCQQCGEESRGTARVT